MNTESITRLGENIKLYRQRQGLTQAELSRHCDITRNMLSRIENGVALPSITSFVAIAQALDIPVGALLDDPKDYLDYKLIGEIRRLFECRQYADILELCEKHGYTPTNAESSSILCAAHIEHARELYNVGRLGEAFGMLDTAEKLCASFPEVQRELRDRIFLLRLLIEASPALSETDSGLNVLKANEDKLRDIVFDKNDLALYLYCRAALVDAHARLLSVPYPEAEALRAKLTPLYESITNNLYREHIAAKLDMADSDFLKAKARILRVMDEDASIPPSIRYELYADLELCCKCCGDFENAYKYSSSRIELIKRIY